MTEIGERLKDRYDCSRMSLGVCSKMCGRWKHFKIQGELSNNPKVQYRNSHEKKFAKLTVQQLYLLHATARNEQSLTCRAFTNFQPITNQSHCTCSTNDGGSTLNIMHHKQMPRSTCSTRQLYIHCCTILPVLNQVCQLAGIQHYLKTFKIGMKNIRNTSMKL